VVREVVQVPLLTADLTVVVEEVLELRMVLVAPAEMGIVLYILVLKLFYVFNVKW
jgi:hypothetical protein